jgi:hypothetical protein
MVEWVVGWMDGRRSRWLCEWGVLGRGWVVSG